MEQEKKSGKYYMIEERELNALLKDRVILTALKAGGVDNWSWYYGSMNDFREEYRQEHEKDIEDFEDTLLERAVEDFRSDLTIQVLHPDPFQEYGSIV